MEHDEGHFRADDGMRLYYQRWWPESASPRAVVVLLHGDFAHSGWYMNLPDYEVPRGYAVYACDRRGWGRSPGRRGYINSWDENPGDLGAFLRLVRNEEPGRPVFLMGHTGSSPIVLDYALRHPADIRGVLCVSPVLNTSAAIPAPLHALLTLLSRIAPRMNIDVRRRFDAGVEWVSHDPAFVKFIREDSLDNTKVTPRWLIESERAMRRVSDQAVNFSLPLLVLVGEADRTSSPASTKAYFQRAGSSDKELIAYPGAYTNLLSDTSYEQVLGDIDSGLTAIYSHT